MRRWQTGNRSRTKDFCSLKKEHVFVSRRLRIILLIDCDPMKVNKHEPLQMHTSH